MFVALDGRKDGAMTAIERPSLNAMKVQERDLLLEIYCI
jgi:hypothetical protein